jgi:hypothetical protein
MNWLALGGTVAMSLLLIAAGCNANSAEDQEYEAAMRRLESQVQEKEITEGRFQRLAIGHSKDESLAELRSMGVQFVRPDLRDEIQVTRSADLEKLRSAPGLIVGAGDVVVSFEDDEVVRIAVAPIFPEWKAMLDPAQSRDQVFEALRKILDEDPDVVVRSHAPDAEHVRVEEPSKAGQKLLGKYDLWKVSYSDDEGQWSLRLQFDQGRLKKIAVWHSPEEVP